MLNRLLLAAVLAAGLTGTATAADLRVKAAPALMSPVPAVNWTGFYVGVHAGGIWGDTGDFVSIGGPPVSIDSSGFLVGVHAGYDYQLPNNWVLGVRIAVPFVASGSNRVSDPVFPAFSYSSDLQWAVALTGSVGYSFGQWLPYVGGGLVFGEGEGTVAGTPFPGTSTQTHTGYTLLAGVRYMVTPRWWVALQYNYTDFDSQTYVFPFGVTRTVDFSSNSLVGMVSYRF